MEHARARCSSSLESFVFGHGWTFAVRVLYTVTGVFKRCINKRRVGIGFKDGFTVSGFGNRISLRWFFSEFAIYIDRSRRNP